MLVCLFVLMSVCVHKMTQYQNSSVPSSSYCVYRDGANGQWLRTTVGCPEGEREREGQDNKKEAASGNGERLSRGRVESESVGPHTSVGWGWTDQQYECLIEAPNRLLARLVYK